MPASSNVFRFLYEGIRAALIFILLILLWSWTVKPELKDEPKSFQEREIDAAKQAMEVHLDAENPPVIWQEVDYTAEDASWKNFRQAPILDKLVKEGELPPVEERIPEEPLVLEGVDGIGTHGGTWFRVANSPSDIDGSVKRIAGSTLVRYSPHGKPIVPHIAKSWEVSNDKRTWTFHLRKGMKFSDGHPFTTEDILFFWENDVLELDRYRPGFMKIKKAIGKMEALDAYTLQLSFPHPNPLLIKKLANTPDFYRPAHYLKTFHPSIGDQSRIEAIMKARDIPTKMGVYNYMKEWDNPELPVLDPWIYRTHRSNSPYTFVRNPYYFAVDSKGQQLPYLDRVAIETINAKLIPNAASGGRMSMQVRHIYFQDYTLLKTQEKKGDYKVHLWYPANRSAWALFPNLNRNVDPAEPATRWKARYLGKAEFRKALSLAIDRERIIKADFNDVGRPAQIAPGRYSPFHYPPLENAYIAYDPERARNLLDAIGLDQRDSEGYRTFPDGTRMTYFIDFIGLTGAGPVDFVIENWRDVGIRAIPRLRTRAFFVTEMMARRQDFLVWAGESEHSTMVQPRSFVATEPSGMGIQAFGWAIWYNGISKQETDEHLGIVEPPREHPMREAYKLFDKALTATTLDEQKKLMHQVMDIAAENLWTISLATPPPQPVVVRNGFRNVPDVALVGWNYRTPANAGLETYYWENPQDSSSVQDQIQKEIAVITHRPGTLSESEEIINANNRLGSLIRWTVLLIFLAGLLLLAFRHPFVGRRLLLMVPTLVIISVITFTIIQVPPGDFIDSKRVQAAMTGNNDIADEVEQLLELFPRDKPILTQYLKWSGVLWFFSFDSEDRGLLQGNLGRSMETRQPVSEVVGDRILLTVLISLGTILFTWVVALPIGIYSAVRQYSPGDYLATIIGFIGMSVPNFLLALILMYFSWTVLGVNISGLFSPEYAARTDWNLGKVLDLLRHIWLPIVVLGTSGTAGMIRIMRGNLLDELKKPYVTTARSKGVKPLKLLMKYPVRLALNPFISSIGYIFPQLISGGAIVAMVMSLPTVGPLLLNALLTEDLYLAGSMLMVLSLLAVLGTLVSDLLLLALDPRIRMGEGSSE